MSKFKALILSLLAVAGLSFGNLKAEYDDNQFAAVQDFLARQKAAVQTRAGVGTLTMSGDVMVEWMLLSESINRSNQTGSGSGNPNHMFDVEANLMVNYAHEMGEAQFKLELDQGAGNYDSDTNDRNVGLRTTLEEAWIRHEVWKDGDLNVNIVLGRRFLGDDLNSKIQFKGIFDGARLLLDTKYPGVGDFYFTTIWGPAHTKNDHFVPFFETGLKNIMDSGVGVRYSFVDWDVSTDTNGTREPAKYKFRNSEFGVNWHVSDDLMSKLGGMFGYETEAEQMAWASKWPLHLYAAFEVNHSAKKGYTTLGKKENTAWYTGFKVGKLEKMGDMAFGARYENVGLQAVPDFDMEGIGLDNVNKPNLYASATRGLGGYKGYGISMASMMSNNLAMTVEWTASNEQGASAHLTGLVRFKLLRIKMIYAF